MIKIARCKCSKNKDDDRAEWKRLADPNCQHYHGSGTIEIDKEERLALDHAIDEMLEHSQFAHWKDVLGHYGKPYNLAQIAEDTWTTVEEVQEAIDAEGE